MLKEELKQILTGEDEFSEDEIDDDLEGEMDEEMGDDDEEESDDEVAPEGEDNE